MHDDNSVFISPTQLLDESLVVPRSGAKDDSVMGDGNENIMGDTLHLETALMRDQ